MSNYAGITDNIIRTYYGGVDPRSGKSIGSTSGTSSTPSYTTAQTNSNNNNNNLSGTNYAGITDNIIKTYYGGVDPRSGKSITTNSGSGSQTQGAPLSTASTIQSSAPTQSSSAQEPTNSIKSQIRSNYSTLFGRNDPDTEGVSYWANEAAKNNWSNADLTKAMTDAGKGILSNATNSTNYINNYGPVGGSVGSQYDQATDQTLVAPLLTPPTIQPEEEQDSDKLRYESQFSALNEKIAQLTELLNKKQEPINLPEESYAAPISQHSPTAQYSSDTRYRYYRNLMNTNPLYFSKALENLKRVNPRLSEVLSLDFSNMQKRRLEEAWFKKMFPNYEPEEPDNTDENAEGLTNEGVF